MLLEMESFLLGGLCKCQKWENIYEIFAMCSTEGRQKIEWKISLIHSAPPNSDKNVSPEIKVKLLWWSTFISIAVDTLLCPLPVVGTENSCQGALVIGTLAIYTGFMHFLKIISLMALTYYSFSSIKYFCQPLKISIIHS